MIKCPECKNKTLDWDRDYDLWRCVRADCGYQRKRSNNEKDPHIISITGEEKK